MLRLYHKNNMCQLVHFQADLFFCQKAPKICQNLASMLVVWNGPFSSFFMETIKKWHFERDVALTLNCFFHIISCCIIESYFAHTLSLYLTPTRTLSLYLTPTRTLSLSLSLSLFLSLWETLLQTQCHFSWIFNAMQIVVVMPQIVSKARRRTA